MLDAAQTTDVQAETLLEVNNIEVIYNHVILVLKGVSLTVPKGGITALLGAMARARRPRSKQSLTCCIQNAARSRKARSSIVAKTYTKATPPFWLKKA